MKTLLLGNDEAIMSPKETPPLLCGEMPSWRRGRMPWLTRHVRAFLPVLTSTEPTTHHRYICKDDRINVFLQKLFMQSRSDLRKNILKCTNYG